jgi:hypothetical protein
LGIQAIINKISDLRSPCLLVNNSASTYEENLVMLDSEIGLYY